MSSLKEVIAQIKEAGLEREVFLYLYRHDSDLCEQMSPDDCQEVFLGILKGQADLDYYLLRNLCQDYDTTLDAVIAEGGYGRVVAV